MNNDYSLMSHQTSWDCWTYIYSIFDSYKWVKYIHGSNKSRSVVTLMKVLLHTGPSEGCSEEQRL